MLKKQILVIFLLKIIFAAIFLLPYSASAKNSYSTFGVQPTKIEFDGSLNKLQETDVLVINFSDHPILVKVTLGDFIFTNNPKQLYIFVKPNELPVSAVPYLKFEPRNIKLRPKEQKKVKLIYNPLGRKILSGKYSAALFAVEGKIKQGKTTVAVAGRIATTIFIVPGKGAIKREGHIKSFKAESSINLNTSLFGLKKSPGFLISYKNTGNTHLNAKGQIYVKDIFGRKIQTINFPEYEVYPGVTRDIEIPWTKPVIGYFKAQVDVKPYLYDYNKSQISKVSNLFYAPYWILIAALLLLMLMVAYFVIKRLRRPKEPSKSGS